MHTEVFYRGDKIGHEDRNLPAVTYNAMRLLFDYSNSSSVFLPIRSMQYMAIIDHEEVIFVDGLCAKKSIEFAWRHFNPQQRNKLTDPVPFRFSYYEEKALETIKRIQWEFDKALHQHHEKNKEKRPEVKAEVIKLHKTKD